MKVFKITAKNLKLLMRSKTSMFVVIFGPLLIMLLVGFAFNNPSVSKLNIGYYTPEKTNLTVSFIDALTSNNNFIVTEYPSEELCKSMIEQGKAHICIVFPTNFQVTNTQSNEVVFFVDQSRANFVYAVIDTVSSKIDITSNQLSFQMTNDLLSTLANTKKSNNDNIQKIITLKDSVNDLSTKLDAVKSKLANIDLKAEQVDTGEALDDITSIQSSVTTLKNKGFDAVSTGQDIADEGTFSNDTLLDGYIVDLEDLQKSINSTSNATLKKISDLSELMDSVNSQVDVLNLKLKNAESATTGSSADIKSTQTNMATLKTDLDALKTSIETINSQINALRVTSAESIVNPITTTVTPISSKSSNLNFVFPYLVILIIVFISIMLSSTIIIIEKTSKAYFRNFTTPTKDFTFISSVFLTSFLVVIVQLVFVLLLAYYFLNTTILSSVLLALLALFASIVLFTFIGMIIGYLFNSQEAVTMASISIGSVFLFLSNLILPLETMSPTIQDLARYNPYVIASELLKKITLFGSEWKVLSSDFVLIGIYVVVTFVLVLIIQKMSKIQYISKKPIAKQIVTRKKEEIIDKYFKLKNGVLLRNENDLHEELIKMSDIMFAEYVTPKKNDFTSWMLLNNNKPLAKILLKCKTRKEMIDALDKYKKQVR
jgi:ABC-type multidrug transport system permease subunit